MGMLFSFMAVVIVISFLSVVIWGLSFLYIKIAKKRVLSSSHKKWGLVSLVIFFVSTSVLFVSSMSQESGNATDTKAKVHKSLSKNKTSDSSNDSDESISSSTKDNSNKNTEFNINSYRTDITYDQLARTPDEFENDKLTMTGKVVQVMENDNDTSNLRVAIDGKFDNIVFVGINNSNLNNSHILKDDLITFYGTSRNLISYESTLGGQITVPAVRADRIDDKGKAPADYGLN